MKRIALLLSLLIISALFLLPASALTETSSTASYATRRPVIDGEIDPIWDFTDEQKLPDAGDLTGCYTKILWAEDGLYLLAVVGDTSLTDKDVDARNSVDFWVSEKNTKANAYNTDPGDWHFCKASDGEECWYIGNMDVYNENVTDRAVKRTEKGYVVELFVRCLSDLKPAEGAVIGYMVSINDDSDGNGTRDDYTFWATQGDGQYWAHTSAFCDVELVKGPDISIVTPFIPLETEAPKETKAPETEAPKETKPAETEAPKETKPAETKAPETKAPETKAPAAPEKKGCGSVLASPVLLLLLAAGFTAKKRRF